MSFTTAGRIVLLALVAVPTTVAARQTFKQQELPKVTSNAEAVEAPPRLELTTDSGQLFPAHLKFESKQRGIDARAQTVKVTYTKVGLSIELTRGLYSSRSGNWGRGEENFQTLLLEFATSGELISEKSPK